MLKHKLASNFKLSFTNNHGLFNTSTRVEVIERNVRNPTQEQSTEGHGLITNTFPLVQHASRYGRKEYCNIAYSYICVGAHSRSVTPAVINRAVSLFNSHWPGRQSHYPLSIELDNSCLCSYVVATGPCSEPQQSILHHAHSVSFRSILILSTIYT
jgi:hypothetical protein